MGQQSDCWTAAIQLMEKDVTGLWNPQLIRFLFAYYERMLSPIQVLTILIQRFEKRADCLEQTRLEGFNDTIYELRNFAQMTKDARSYLEGKPAHNGAGKTGPRQDEL